MKWTPDPFKHTAQITVTTWLSQDTSAELTVEDIAVEDATAAMEYFAAQMLDVAKKLKPKRRSHKKKPQPASDSPSPTEKSP